MKRNFLKKSEVPFIFSDFVKVPFEKRLFQKVRRPIYLLFFWTFRKSVLQRDFLEKSEVPFIFSDFLKNSEVPFILLGKGTFSKSPKSLLFFLDFLKVPFEMDFFKKLEVPSIFSDFSKSL